MSRINSLYDAIIRYKVKEDQCTNYLLWLLKKLPSNVITEILTIADLSINNIPYHFDFIAQYPLSNSRADALIETLDDKYIVTEVKRYSNAFDTQQFANHFSSAKDEFGKDKVWGLFISGDDHIPNDLLKFKKKHNDRVGFLSWKDLLKYLSSYKNNVKDGYEILINEFLIFAKHYKLGSVISMNKDNILEFLKVYPIVRKFEEPLLEKFNQFIIDLKDKIIIQSEEMIEENEKDKLEKFPTIYRAINLKGWFIPSSSGFLFLDIVTAQVGVLLTGYQGIKEKKDFIIYWNDKIKNKFKEDEKLFAFTFDDDEVSFKIIGGTKGKIINPTKISAFEQYFYWGYVYELDLDNLNSYLEKIPKDYMKLVNDFLDSP